VLKEIGRVITNNQQGPFPRCVAEQASAFCSGTRRAVLGPRKWTAVEKKISIPLFHFNFCNEFLIYVGFITIAMTVEVSSVYSCVLPYSPHGGSKLTRRVRFMHFAECPCLASIWFFEPDT
jgi:hypothetical protein